MRPDLDLSKVPSPLPRRFCVPAYELERMPEGGGYPQDLIELAGERLGVTDYSRVLHLCSGSVRSALALDWRPPWGRWTCPPEEPYDHPHLYEADCALRQDCDHEPRHAVRAGSSCSVVGDARRLPIGTATVRWVMVDPPYGEEYAQALWGTGKVYPTPAAILKECARILRPGGGVAFLHQIVPAMPQGLVRVETLGITTGPGYRIRALTIARRPATLF